MIKYLETIVPPFVQEPVAKPPSESLFKFIWYFAKPFRVLLLCLFLSSAILSAVEVYMFSVIGQLVDLMQNSKPDEFLVKHKDQLLFAAILIVFIWPLTSVLSTTIKQQGLLANFAMQIRWRAHRYLLRQSTGFYANEFAGRISARVMQTALSLRDTVILMNSLLVYTAVYFTSTLVIFASMDVRLIMPLLIWLMAYIVVMRFFLPRVKERSSIKSSDCSLMVGRMVDAYSNIQTVKMFSSYNSEENYALSSMKKMLHSLYRQLRLVTGLNTTLICLNALMVSGTMGFAIWLWTQSIVSTGSIAVAGALTLRIHTMSQSFIWDLAKVFEKVGNTQDGKNTIAKALAVADVDNAKELEVKEGKIEFSKLNFSYSDSEPVFENFSLTIKPGERVGLVGQSGAGKSSLVNLLLRLYDVDSGQIRIDGQNIAHVKQESLRENIAMVTQDTSLLHRTIRENIAYGRVNPSDNDIHKAIKLARADDFIFKLDDHQNNRGLNAQVGERGVKLSGGQRQRIAIARVILKNAPILLLDEATSALDSDTEAAIQESFETLMENKTVIAIAHRLSTIAMMDRILVLNDGQIVEDGTHNELLQKNGVYAHLWARQSGGFIADE